MTQATPPSVAPVPVWLQPGWDGPPLETRPADADASWPEGAHHRVRFDQERFGLPFHLEHGDAPFYYEYFGTDGWPLFIPDKLKPRLDPGCIEGLHRQPRLWRKRCWSENIILINFQILPPL